MNRIIKYVVIGILVFLINAAGFAVTIKGVEVPESITQSDTKQTLLLNGAGIRSKFVFSIYVGALYLPQKKNAVSEILAQGGPNRVSMHFLYDEVSKEKLTNGWSEGFANNNTEDEMKKLLARLDSFNSLFKTVVKGDVIVLDYVPDNGTHVIINNQRQGVIPGRDFNQALLKVWLGNDPADSGLKEAMLGNVNE